MRIIRCFCMGERIRVEACAHESILETVVGLWDFSWSMDEALLADLASTTSAHSKLTDIVAAARDIFTSNELYASIS